MKRLLPLLFVLLVSTPAHAVPPDFAVAMPAGTPFVTGTPGQAVSAAADKYGVVSVAISGSGGTGATQSIIPASNATALNGVAAPGVGYQFTATDVVEAASTSTVIVATAHVARIGDALSFRTGTAANVGTWSTVSAVTANSITLSNALPATPAAADSFFILRPQPLSVNANNGTATSNSLNVSVNTDGQPSAATGLLKLEDAVAASGDALVGVAGVIESSSTPVAPAADGDYASLMLGQFGQAVSTVIHDGAYGVNFTATALEDGTAMATDGGAGVKILAQTQDPLSVDQGTTGDAAYLKVDRAGRTITTLAPAGESWATCSALVTDTTTTDVKPLVTSNRIYVTSISCSNSSAVPSNVAFFDNATVIYRGAIPAVANGGTYTATLPVPLRTASGVAFRFAMGTTATSTYCCASGYISVN